MKTAYIVSLALVFSTSLAESAEWQAAPNGTPEGKGTKDMPWDLGSALADRHRVVPGDTLWVAGGTYHKPADSAMGFPVALVGREGAPIRVRVRRGERATVDGGLVVQAPADHVWIEGLELLVSQPRPAQPVPPDPTYRNVNRPWGGLNVNAGVGCKYINLVIHDNCQGVSFWSGARDSELYGCLIYDNGWQGTDRGHGHAIYTQNRDGTKTIRDCIMTGGYGYSMHAYGSKRADVDNYLIEGNIIYKTGTFLVGGGKPSHNIRVRDNYLHGAPLQIGYNAPYNESCEVSNNVVVNGELSINRYRKVVKEGNLVLGKNDARPRRPRVIVRPNRYEAGRAHVAVYSWGKEPVVEVDVSGVLQAGDHYRLVDPRAFFGKPVLAGKYDGKPVRVPVNGEFSAFVLLRESSPP